MGNSATSKVVGEGTIQFRSHDGCITSHQGVRYVPDQDTISSFLETYIEKGFVSFRKVILWKFSKETNVMFQADRVSNVYMLRNSEVTVGDCSYHRLQKRWLWNNRRLRWIRARMFNCTLKGDWD